MNRKKTIPPAANDVAAEPSIAPVIEMAAFRRRRAAAGRQIAGQIADLRGVGPGSIISVSCRNYMVGREDWCRGLRSLFRSFEWPVRATYEADGSLHLHDLPVGELVFSAQDVSQALAHGLHYRAADFEADIAPKELRAALPKRARVAVVGRR